MEKTRPYIAATPTLELLILLTTPPERGLKIFGGELGTKFHRVGGSVERICMPNTLFCIIA